MAIKLNFDRQGNIIWPVASLLTRGGRWIGSIKSYDLHFRDSMEDASEISFSVNKRECTKNVWDKLVDFKLLYMPEWKQLYDITVQTDETPSGIIKTVTGKSLGESELSQINVYGVEINTEDDINRDDYEPTCLYHITRKEQSLLDRILEKAPHYRIGHVDERIASIQRTFSFDDKSILDCLRDICEEIQCHLDISCYVADNGRIAREINLYDMLSYCKDCGQRGEFWDVCTECGSDHVEPGYGEDTTVYCSVDNLADNISYHVDADSTKNCFYMSAGDDLMTATIASCNPNGTGYLWCITDDVKEDMSEELAERIGAYEAEYDEIYKNHTFDNNEAFLSLADKYNAIVKKYMPNDDDSSKYIVDPSCRGFKNAIQSYYNAIDFCIYLKSGMVPSFEMENTDASKEIANVIPHSFTVGVKDLKTCSASSVDSAVISLLKTIINCSYKITLLESSYFEGVWSGKIYIENYGDENDNATSATISFPVNDDYIEFTKQKVEAVLANAENTKYDIKKTFKLGDDEFIAELRKYGVDGLKMLHDVCQGCIDVLIKQGASNKSNACGSKLYEEVYVPYYNKLTLIETEIIERESEMSSCEDLLASISEQITSVQDHLNFEKYLGEELLCEFASYRREESYKNDNYISDGLNNAQLIENALDFIDKAKNEIKKAAEGKHQIDGTLKNLLAMREFAGIVDKFCVGNWIRVRVDDSVYRLRLISYEINESDSRTTNVEFSDASVFQNSVGDVRSILSSASSMATSYGAVMRQAKYGYQSKKKFDSAASDGIDAADFKLITKSADGSGQNQEWGPNGLICKDYDKDTGRYDDEQLKLLSNGLMLTSDNWKTAMPVIGKYQFQNASGKIETVYGVNAELLIGGMILGKNMTIKNDDGTMNLDGTRFKATNGVTTFCVDVNADKIMRIDYRGNDLIYVDSAGQLFISGDGRRIDISANQGMIDVRSAILKNKESIKSLCETMNAQAASVDELSTAVDELSTASADQEQRIIVLEGEINSIISRLEELENKQEV